jgi:16S rRNA A1518/A1519 N6-dimethyltransferase RsmA/KsgA/DIM1 with predicted DNA glycosylase/AP lyase activity
MNLSMKGVRSKLYRLTVYIRMVTFPPIGFNLKPDAFRPVPCVVHLVFHLINPGKNSAIDGKAMTTAILMRMMQIKGSAA